MFLLVRFTIGVTGQARSTVVLIARDLVMVVVGLCLMMAGETSKNGVIIWVGMAIVALIPFSLVRSAVDREMLGIMVPGGRHPRIL